MRLLIIFLAVLFNSSAFAAKPYQLESLMLMQPDIILRDRIGSTQELANYVTSVGVATESALAAVAPTPTSGFIVLAVRPNGASKVWLDLSPALPTAVGARLRTSIEAVAPFPAKNGVVVFAINASLWGAAPSTQETPKPAEWLKVTEYLEGAIEIGDLVDRVWPAKPGT